MNSLFFIFKVQMDMAMSNLIQCQHSLSWWWCWNGRSPEGTSSLYFSM